LVVPVLDLDAIELHRSAADPELERSVLVLAVATYLVVVDAPLDLLGSEVLPLAMLRGGRLSRPEDEWRGDHGREPTPGNR
jgi:hypothetical protein